jgi:hypothetical protein
VLRRPVETTVIKGVGVIAGGPFWCAKADADDFINGFTLPIITATGSCMKGPPPDLNVFIRGQGSVRRH